MQNSGKYINREGWLAIVANLLLFGLKYWVGIMAGSIALIADAWHTLTDSISSIIVVIGGKVSRKPADEDHPFGHGRAEHIAAMIIGVLLALVAFDFMLNAVERLKSREEAVFGPLAIGVTILSIVLKELLAQYAFWAYKKTKSNILKADGWHHRSDAISSFIILIGILLGSYFWWMDSVLGLIVAALIGYASYEILSTEFKALLGESPPESLVKEIRETAQRVYDQPLYMHHIQLHTYGNHAELICHIKLPPTMALEEAHEICTAIEEALYRQFGFISTIHPEPIGKVDS